MKEESQGVVLRIERTSMHDGAGLRTVIFLKGCPLRCLWCSSPESQIIIPERGYKAERCRSCGECITSCSVGALSMDMTKVMHDKDLCQQCNTCVESCTADALCFYGREMKISEVMAEIVKDEVFYFHSGGGVTISGGECLLQPDFTAAILQQCRHHGIDATVETSLHASWDNILKITPYLSSIFVDLKHPEPQKHQELTGVDNSLIFTNLEKLNALEQPLDIRLRVPLIPGINDDNVSLRQMAAIAERLPKVSCIEILPYHRLGVTTYDTLKRNYVLSELQTPSAEYIAQKKVYLRKWLQRVVMVEP